MDDLKFKPYYLIKRAERYKHKNITTFKKVGFFK